MASYLRRGTYTCIAALMGGLSGGNLLLAGETEGFAIDATISGGSVSVIDTGTPANDLSNVTFANSNLVNSSTSAKYVINSDLSLTLTSVGDIPQSYDIANSRYGILIEPAATNLQVQSQTFDNAAWGKSRVTVTANTVAAPDGTTTAETLTEDSTATNTHQIWDQLTLAGGTVATISIYVKAGTRDIFAFTYGGQSGHWVTQIYDLTGAGDFGEVSTGGTSGTLVDKTITALANGWYRVTLTASITNINPWIGISAAPLLTGNTFSATGNTTWSGNGTGTVHIWGVQAEASAFATSYIPTVAATVTRAVDDITVATSTIPFQDSPGTLYADFMHNDTPAATTRTVAMFDINAATNTEAIKVGTFGTDPFFGVRDASVSTVDIDLGTVAAGTRYQIAGAWDTNNCAASMDGTAATADTSCTMPAAIDILQFGAQADLTNPMNGYIYRFFYAPRRLLNADLEVKTGGVGTSFGASYETVVNTPTVSGNDNTFSTVDFGAAHSTRKIYCVYNTRATTGRTISSATIGGVAATIHVQQVRTAVGADQMVGIFSADVPTGTSGDVVVTLSGTPPAANRQYLGVYRVLNQTGAVDDTDSVAAGAGSGTRTLNPTVVGGAVIAGCTNFNATDNTWTGPTENYDLENAGHAASQVSGALLTGVAGITQDVSVSGTSGSDIAFAAVAFH
jgi:hypothetical protein